MIKLTRGPKPVELTTTVQANLTNEFKTTGISVWNLPYIKKNLLAYSHEKCCYCESNINEESKYLEVEHFHPKNLYDEEVLEWSNLLPSCKKCNGTKGDHDTVVEPIINPTDLDPKDHLKYWNFRIRSSSDIGKMTISVLDLNNQDRLIQKRFEIGSALHKKLEDFVEWLEEYVSGAQNSTRRKNRIINGLKSLMREGLPGSIYSATSASVILNDLEYINLKNAFVVNNFWDTELIQLEIDLIAVALPPYL